MNYFIAKQPSGQGSVYYNLCALESSNESEYKAIGDHRTFDTDESMWRRDAATCLGAGGAINAAKVTTDANRVDITDIIPLVQSSVLIDRGLTTGSYIAYNNNGVMTRIQVKNIPTIAYNLTGTDRSAAVIKSGMSAVAQKINANVSLTISVNNKINNIEAPDGNVITDFPATISIENGDAITINANADPIITLNYTNTKEPVITDTEGG